jgi:hypothetical protein
VNTSQVVLGEDGTALLDEKSSDVLNAVLVWTCSLDLLASEAFKRGTLARDP